MSELWLESWWRAYGAGRQRRRLAAGAEVWPLYEPRPRHLALLGPDYSRHSLPRLEMIPPQAAHLARQRDWDQLLFTSLPIEQAAQWHQSLTDAGIAVHLAPVRRQRFLPLDRPWEEVEGDFKPGLLRNIQKRERALAKTGPIHMRIHTSGDGLEAIFAACLELEASGWKGAQGTDIASRPQARAFYQRLGERAAASGALHLALLYSGTTLIAFSFDLLAGPAGGAVLAGGKVGYHHDWRKYAPGMVLQLRLVQHLHQRGITEFDLGGGDDAYKAEWTPHTRELTDVRAFNRTARGRAASLIVQARAALQARLRPQPLSVAACARTGMVSSASAGLVPASRS